jgi:type II secretory pathway component PulJ
MQMRYSRGFTLTETLVALIAGMIVVGAVMVFAITAMRSNAQVIAGAQLQQQMRHTLDQVTADIRRAGYYDDAARYAPTAQAGLSDVPVIRSPSCIVVRYDRNGSLYRGYRYAARNGIGVIQTATSRDSAPECSSAGGSVWRDITDPATVDVLEFSFAPVAGAAGCTSLHGVAVTTQDIDVKLKARQNGDAHVERSLSEATRVRNDIMAAGSCT